MENDCLTEIRVVYVQAKAKEIPSVLAYTGDIAVLHILKTRNRLSVYQY